MKPTLTFIQIGRVQKIKNLQNNSLPSNSAKIIKREEVS